MDKKRKNYLRKQKGQKERKQSQECFDEVSEKQTFDSKDYERRGAVPPIFDFGTEPWGIYHCGMDLSADPRDPAFPISMIFQIGGIPVSLQQQIIDKCCLKSEIKKHIRHIFLVGQDSYLIKIEIAMSQDKIGIAKLYFPELWDMVAKDIFGADGKYLNADLGYWSVETYRPDEKLPYIYIPNNPGAFVYKNADCEALNLDSIIEKRFKIKNISEFFDKPLDETNGK